MFNINSFFIFAFPVIPHIESFNFPNNTHSGQTVQVMCFVSEGDTPLELYWSFQGQTLSPHEGVSIIKLGLKGSLLLLDPVYEMQAGSYICTARNRAGTSYYAAVLFVNGMTS